MQPLQPEAVSATVSHPVSDLSDRVRLRLREEMDRRGLSQQDVADLLKWTQSKVAQKLTGRTPMTLDELDALCFAVSLRPTEVVRDRGYEFCADLTPTEMRILERVRERGQHVIDSILNILEPFAPHARKPLERRGGPKKPILGRPRIR